MALYNWIWFDFINGSFICKKLFSITRTRKRQNEYPDTALQNLSRLTKFTGEMHYVELKQGLAKHKAPDNNNHVALWSPGQTIATFQGNLYVNIVGPAFASSAQTVATFWRNLSQLCWTQHMARVWPSSGCDMLRHVATCCALEIELVRMPGQTLLHEPGHTITTTSCNIHKMLRGKFDHFQTWANNTQHVATRRNSVAKRSSMLHQQCYDMLRWNVLIVWPGLYNEHLFFILMKWTAATENSMSKKSERSDIFRSKKSQSDRNNQRIWSKLVCKYLLASVLHFIGNPAIVWEA